MLTYTSSFSSFSVDDLIKAKEFYSQTLGFEVQEMAEMGFSIRLKEGASAFVYPKNGHQPAEFTILNFVVEDIDATVNELQKQGIQIIRYNDENLPQDEKGIHRGLNTGRGPDIAWFEDPAGNVLSVLQDNSET